MGQGGEVGRRYQCVGGREGGEERQGAAIEGADAENRGAKRDGEARGGDGRHSSEEWTDQLLRFSD